jgi:hypothetical protein
MSSPLRFRLRSSSSSAISDPIWLAVLLPSPFS